MKAVPKVNTDGLYIEDELVDDTFSGVVPFYAPKPEQLLTDPVESELPKAPEDEEEREPEIAGYLVSVRVTPGLFHPRFDFVAWTKYQEDRAAAQEAYDIVYEEWTRIPEEDRGAAPEYQDPEEPILWVEGLTPEEIEAILNPPNVPETDAEKLVRLEQENHILKAQNTALSDRADFIEDVIAEMALQVYQ